MANNITVTGNEAQFNENVTFLKDILVSGALRAGQASSAEGGGGVQIGDNLTVSGIITTTDLTVLRYTDLQGITTVGLPTTSDPDLHRLQINTTASIGIGGTAGDVYKGVTILPFGDSSGENNRSIAFVPHEIGTENGISTNIGYPSGVLTNKSVLNITSTGVGIGTTQPESRLKIGDRYWVDPEEAPGYWKYDKILNIDDAHARDSNGHGYPGIAIGRTDAGEYAIKTLKGVYFADDVVGTPNLLVKPYVDADDIGGIGIGQLNPGRATGADIIPGPPPIINDSVMLHINQGGSSSVVVGSTGNIGAGIGSVSRINYSQNDGPAHRLQLNEFWRESNPLLGGSSKYVFVDRDGGVGIGTSSLGSFSNYDTGKPIRLDVKGGARIKGHLYDSADSPGVNGYYLNMDGSGIRWIEAQADELIGLYVQDDSTYLPKTGTAQTFFAINFTDLNSLGIGTNTIEALPDPDNPTGIARIRAKDYWGYEESGAGDDEVSIFRMTKVGIKNNNPTADLDVGGTLNVDNNTTLKAQLDVDGDTFLNQKLDVDGDTTLHSILEVDQATTLKSTLSVANVATFNDTTDSSGSSSQSSVLIKGGLSIERNVYTGKEVVIEDDTPSISPTTGALVVTGGVGIQSGLNVGTASTFKGNVELDSSLIDVTGNISGPGVGQTDWRLSSVGTGVSWRPPGVQTKRTIWVTKNGNDANSGLLEGDAKASVGAAASIANEDDTIKVRAGVYYENNPIGLRTDVSITGEDLRLVTIIPNNPTKDVVHVRNGCLVENVNFTGQTKYTSHKGAGAVAFPPPAGPDTAASGYLQPGPFSVPSGKRYKSPYVRNCTNFMCESIGMKIDGDNATALTFGQDLKSMVCDSFTQYNEAGVGVSLTNDGYAQLVSIFTINCDIAIFAGTGGQCDLTNSNSSFGNFGLVAVGLGSTQFTGFVSNTDPAGDFITATEADTDTIVCADVFDTSGNARRPFDGQALFFKIDLDNYPDALGSGVLTEPLQQLDKIVIETGANVTGYSPIDPPGVIIRDADGTQEPKGPQGIIAEASASVDATGRITSVNVVASGRNYLPSQNIVVDIEGNTGIASAQMEPIFYTIDSATDATPAPTFPATNNSVGICTLTFSQFIPYQLFPGDQFSLQRISRILTSSHSFEYVGTGTDINRSTPLQGALPIKDNEIVASEGAQIPFTSTDQKGNFDIGEGIQVDQTTATIRGRDFSRAIQAEVTPLILALR